MNLNQLADILEQLAPLAYAEDFDNVGFLTKHTNNVSGILVCHDALETVLEEAIAKKCNVVVCFHPILFAKIKKITGSNYVERAIIKAIKNDIAIYAIHTALDNHQQGVNKILCDALGLLHPKILIPKENYIEKLVTYCPVAETDKLKKALFSAGAGHIGNYSECSFVSNGLSSYKGNENTNPTIGIPNIYHEEAESKIEVIYEKHLQSKIIKALHEVHIYEEVAYEIYSLQNKQQEIGLGMYGELPNAMNETDFLEMVKKKMQCGVIRHSDFLNKNIQKVAVLGGSGAFAIEAAKREGVDAFLTADLKYHDFYTAENKLLLADIGHFESERYTKNYIVGFLKEKITNFAVQLSEVNTNPVKYF
jgi:dinuclear metal center YbgI/SA1388 family protein